MKKLLLKLSLILVLCGGLVYLNSAFLAPTLFKTRMEVVSSPKIPESLNNLSIAVISDLKGDVKALDKSIKAIHDAQAEIVVIMGDVLGTELDEEQTLAYQAKLESITSSYGKFIILESESDRDNLDKLGFHLLTTSTLKIHHEANEYINLQVANTNGTYVGNNEEVFSIFISQMDNLDSISSYDYTITGISEDDLIKIPFIKNDFKKKLVKDGVTSMKHMGSNTQEEYRLMTNPEIIILTLKSQ